MDSSLQSEVGSLENDRKVGIRPRGNVDDVNIVA